MAEPSASTAERAELRGRHVLVTGASSGIGLACPRVLLRVGARVAALVQDETQAAQAQPQLPDARVLVQDLQDLQATLGIVRRISQARGLSFRLATVGSDIGAGQVIAAMRDDRLAPLGAMPESTEDAVRGCSHIVGQCGTGALLRALALAPDVLIAGRCCDTAVFAALPEMLGYPVALCQHMAKIIECTSLCCSPGGRDAMLAELTHDGFTLESMNPLLHATPQSVAAHALYEQANPLRVEEPGGTLDLRGARYEALDAHRTQVRSARFEARAAPTLKIEAASRVGARAVLPAGVADPTLLHQLPEVLVDVETRVRTLVPGAWQLFSHVYGQGAVRPLLQEQHSSHEAGLVLEFIAPEAGMARLAAGVFKQNLLHVGCPGRMSTAGNLAFAFTPSELDAHEAQRFVLYHVMHDAPLPEIFSVRSIDVDGQPVH